VRGICFTCHPLTHTQRNAPHNTDEQQQHLTLFGLLCWCGPQQVSSFGTPVETVDQLTDGNVLCSVASKMYVTATLIAAPYNLGTSRSHHNSPLCHVQRPLHLFFGAKGRVDTPLCSSSAHSFKGRRFVYCATAADRFRSIVLACEGEESLCLTSRPFGYPPTRTSHHPFVALGEVNEMPFFARGCPTSVPFNSLLPPSTNTPAPSHPQRR
jgi:hypothetical protein